MILATNTTSSTSSNPTGLIVAFLVLFVLCHIVVFWGCHAAGEPWIHALLIFRTRRSRFSDLGFVWFGGRIQLRRRAWPDQKPNMHLHKRREGIPFRATLLTWCLDPNKILWMPSVSMHARLDALQAHRGGQT